MQPLTHHEIIGIVEPFTRRGRHVDLGASKRLERWLVFRPVEHQSDTAGPARLRETLRLDNPNEGWFRLTRTLQPDSGPPATLTIEGDDVRELLERIDGVPIGRQFSAGVGFSTASSYRIELPSSQPAAPAAKLILTEAIAQIGGFTLTLRVPRTRSMAAEIELAAPEGSAVVLPEDLLAVIGWDWAPLRERKGVWTSKLRLRGKEPRRSASAEIKLERTLRHLAHTLSQPPAEFHRRHLMARWGAALRRGIPSLAALGMIAGVAMLPRAAMDDFSPLRLMMFNLPALLLALAFSMQELPRFEIPPVPRRLPASAWPPQPLRSSTHEG